MPRSGPLAATFTSQKILERSTEVRVEDMVDDWIQHGSAVGKPFQGYQHLRGDIVSTWGTCPLQQIKK